MLYALFSNKGLFNFRVGKKSRKKEVLNSVYKREVKKYTWAIFILCDYNFPSRLQ